MPGLGPVAKRGERRMPLQTSPTPLSYESRVRCAPRGGGCMHACLDGALALSRQREHAAALWEAGKARREFSAKAGARWLRCLHVSSEAVPSDGTPGAPSTEACYKCKRVSGSCVGTVVLFICGMSGVRAAGACDTERPSPFRCKDPYSICDGSAGRYGMGTRWGGGRSAGGRKRGCASAMQRAL